MTEQTCSASPWRQGLPQCYMAQVVPPLRIAVQHERRPAWRLLSGQWLMSVDRIARLDSCRPEVINETSIASAEAQLGL